MATASTSTNWRLPKHEQEQVINRNTKSNAKSKHIKSRVKEHFWHKVTWNIPFYRCQACHHVMSKKEPSTTPQQIYSCGHITCANCIVNSFFVELNPLCPVDGCGKRVNPRDNRHVNTPLPPLNILQGNMETTDTKLDESRVTTSCSSPTNEVINPAENHHKPLEEENLVIDKGFQDIIDSYLKMVDYKRISLFETIEQLDDDDALACGCIDMCRGRCGIYDNKYDRDFDYRTTY
jgi:hypothetical protein